MFALSFLDNCILETVNGIAIGLSLYIIFLLPVYVVIILFLEWRRHRQGTNKTGMKLYHGLSLILPTLLFALMLNLLSSGGLQLTTSEPETAFNFMTTGPNGSTPTPCRTVVRDLQPTVSTTKSAVQRRDVGETEAE